MQPTPTRSPTAYFVTSAPTSATIPAISCPTTIGYGVGPHSLRAVWMSEWQMPAYLMSIRTSCGPTSRRSIVVGASGSVADGAAYAFTVVVTVLLGVPVLCVQVTAGRPDVGGPDDGGTGG